MYCQDNTRQYKTIQDKTIQDHLKHVNYKSKSSKIIYRNSKTI